MTITGLSVKLTEVTCFSKLSADQFLVLIDRRLRSLLVSNDLGKVDSNFFCYAATVLSPHRNVLIFTQRMHKPT